MASQKNKKEMNGSVKSETIVASLAASWEMEGFEISSEQTEQLKACFEGKHKYADILAKLIEKYRMPEEG